MTLEEAFKADPMTTAKFIIEQHGRVLLKDTTVSQ